jgi:hypothetical protein
VLLNLGVHSTTRLESIKSTVSLLHDQVVEMMLFLRIVPYQARCLNRSKIIIKSLATLARLEVHKFHVSMFPVYSNILF